MNCSYFCLTIRYVKAIDWLYYPSYAITADILSLSAKGGLCAQSTVVRTTMYQQEKTRTEMSW